MRWLAGVLLALGTVACATTTTQNPFDEHMAARRYEDAVRTFEADSALWGSPASILIVGRLYADRALSTYDPVRARFALTRLATDFPESDEAQQARPLLTLWNELDQLREELVARTAALEERAALADTLTASREAVQRDLEAMRRRVERLEAELEEARRELERLKAVDLRPRPGAPR